MRRFDVPALAVFFILLGSYAFFWHTRDWNTASRLMLTYALVDRDTLSISGLDQQTGDKAYFRGKYYSDKLPGYPLLAVPPYFLAKRLLGLPDHPLGARAMPYWAADYWITLGTSGLLTAAAAVLLLRLARNLGCRDGWAVLVALAYGLATPAYVYATLAYGHQATAFALLAAMLLIDETGAGPERVRPVLAGFLTALASAVELQVAPASAILGFFLLARVLARRCHPLAIGFFALGALVPTLILLTYNWAAFGSPWDMGYFHHVVFSHVHSRRNPLGILAPDWSKVGPLLWGRYRGLLAYAPILTLAVPGWWVLFRSRRWSLAIVSFLICAALLLVNLSYPEWTGGWCTGPRLLTPLIPFAMIPVAALLGVEHPGMRFVRVLALVLAVLGGVEMFLFQGADARVPNEVWDLAGKTRVPLAEPLRDAVWPLWTGNQPDPRRRYCGEFSGNLVALAAPGWVAGLPPRWRFLQMMPLAIGQVLAIAGLAGWCGGQGGGSGIGRPQRNDPAGRPTTLVPASQTGQNQWNAPGR